MVGLTATMTLASQALSAESGALSITNNNIANVNTPGYSREVVQLSADATVSSGQVQGNGVAFGNFTSVRDQILQIGINQKTSDAASLTTQSTLWTQVANGFSSTGSGLGASLSDLFSSLSGLSTTPTDASARQAALSSAADVVDSFHQAAATLASAQGQANSVVTATVAQINQLSSQIADLNGQLATLQSSGQDGGSIEDQRDQLTTQLAQLTGLASTSTQSTPTLSTGNGTPLVVGSSAYALQAVQGTDGKVHVLDTQGADVTSTLTGGSLGGALVMRDQTLPSVGSTLDQFASQFAQAINTAQGAGFDQSGNAGQPLFQLPSGSGGAAANIELSTSSPSALALSSEGTSGSSGNLSNLLGVQTQVLPSGESPTDTYASLVQQIGTSSSGVASHLTATNAALTQLTTQQASESGVSIDEETTNLLRYQQAYTAAAKVVSTINSLYTTLMNMDSTQ